MDIYKIACGEKTAPAWLTPNSQKSAFANQVVKLVDGDDDLFTYEHFEMCGVKMYDTRRTWGDLYCIHLLRLSGYTVVTQPLIPDFGLKYADNMRLWESDKTITTTKRGSRLQLLRGLEIFKSARHAKHRHAQLLKAWNSFGTRTFRNACVAPPIIRYRADLWSKVRDYVRYFVKVYPYAMFWMEESAKRLMRAEFDENGQCQLIGRGAQRERDAMMGTLRDMTA